MKSRERAPGALRLRGSSGGHRGAPGPTKRRALPHQEGIDLFADDLRSLHLPPQPPTFHRRAGRPKAGVKLKSKSRHPSATLSIDGYTTIIKCITVLASPPAPRPRSASPAAKGKKGVTPKVGVTRTGSE